MNLNEYQNHAAETDNSKLSVKDKMANYAMGISSESGEVTDIIKKVRFHGHDLDRDDLIKEMGDVLWYLSMIARVCGIAMDEVAETNIAKLRKRYPHGFNRSDSIKRVDVTEGDS
jgi:Predicted pyrophosphatase